MADENQMDKIKAIPDPAEREAAFLKHSEQLKRELD